MFTKPKYRQILPVDIKPGMRIYSKMLGEAFRVERIETKGGMLLLIDGCFAMRTLKTRPVWRETLPRKMR